MAPTELRTRAGAEPSAWDEKYAPLMVEPAEVLRARVAAVGGMTLARVLCARAAPAQRVLEAGSGTGRILSYLALTRGVSGIGIDTSMGALHVGRRAAKVLDLACRYVGGDLARLPFPAARFDLVFSDSVIDHLDDVPSAMAEMARVLRPGGTLVATGPNRLRPDGWDLYRRLRRVPYRQRSFTPWELSALLRRTGLTIEGFFGDTLVLWRNIGRLSAPLVGRGSPLERRYPAVRRLPSAVLRRMFPPWLYVDLGIIAQKPGGAP